MPLIKEKIFFCFAKYLKLQINSPHPTKKDFESLIKIFKELESAGIDLIKVECSSITELLEFLNKQ